MSLLDDHGTYLENDEEVVIPLLRQLDTPDGPPSRSRFFRDRASELIRVEWRRQRVGMLAAWRWISLVAAVVAIGGASLHALLLHGDRLRRLGETTAVAWSLIPGGSLVVSPVELAGRTGGLARLVPDRRRAAHRDRPRRARPPDPRPGGDRPLERLGRARALADPERAPALPERRGPYLEAAALIGLAVAIALVVALT